MCGPLHHVVFRRVVGERAWRQRSDDLVPVTDLERLLRDHRADACPVQVPAGEGALHQVLAAGSRDHEHPLLRLREHHLVRRHAARAPRNPRHIDAHAGTALRGHLARGADEARRADVLDGLDRVGRDELKGRLEEQLLEERVAHLDRGPLFLGSGAELERGQQGRSGDAVAPGVAAHQVHRASGPRLAGRAQIL